MDLTANRSVAVKMLGPAWSHDDATVRRLIREGAILAACQHPHIVRVFDVITTAKGTLLVLEDLEGPALDHHIPADGLPLDEGVRLGLQIASGISAVHQRGYIIGDIKLANVVLGAGDLPKLVDFGSARAMKRRSGMAPIDFTETPAAGTPGCMSPEQLCGRKLSVRSDIFSFGVLLWHVLTGQRPFIGASAAELAAAVLRDEPASPPDRLPAEVTSIIQRCLQKDPRRRFGSMRSVEHALRCALMAHQTRTSVRPRLRLKPTS
jgi:serine/threonine protein kinase